jgi:hypothetical protein
MDIDLGANAGIRENEANGVVDASRGEFVGIEEQRCDRKAGRVGAGAPFSSSGRRIDPVEIPHSEEGRIKSAIYKSGLKCLIEFPVTAVCHYEMAIAFFKVALITGLVFHAASDGKRNRRDAVGIPGV